MKIFNRNLSVSRREIEAYIGPSAYSPFYSKALEKFINNSSSPIWNWPSFFIGLYWLMFRKAFKPALVLFLANLALMTFIPLPLSSIFALGILIFMGLYGTNLYFLNAEREIIKVRDRNALLSEDEKLVDIANIGGTDYKYPIIFYIGQVILYSFIL